MCYYVYEKFSSAGGGRSAALGVIIRLDVDGRGHRGGRIVKGCGLAVGTGDTVALRVGCLDDELQVGLKRIFFFLRDSSDNMYKFKITHAGKVERSNNNVKIAKNPMSFEK